MKNTLIKIFKNAVSFTKSNLHLFLVALTLTFIIFATAIKAVPLKIEKEKCVDVFSDTIRLRVVANSDSDADQKLKLAVRNDIISTAHSVFKGCNNAKDAEKTVRENLDLLENKAKEAVKKAGKEMDVKVRLVREKCPVRRYSEFVFPAGEYLTLRIDLGKAQGENWWCVMFPPLCVSASANDVFTDESTLMEYGFSEKQVDYLKKPKIKFLAVEMFERKD